MPPVLYHVVFQQKLRPGFSIESMQRKLQDELQLSERDVDQLFSAPRIIIKHNLELLTARQYERRLFLLGLIVELERADTPPASAINSASAELEESDVASRVSVLGRTSDTIPPEGIQELAVPTYPQAMPLTFSGNGWEYFKIWIVNLALSILTLGVYSAWAKVRNQQYFYGNTALAGASFEYTVQLLAILKGRLIAVAVIGLYYLISTFLSVDYAVLFYIALAFLFIALFPWVVIKSLQLNARHSCYRNVAFSFNGSYAEALKAFILWPLLGLFFVFLPFVWHRKTRFFIRNSAYGTETFHFIATGNDYYVNFGKLLLMGLGLILVALIPLLQVVLVPLVYLLILAFFQSSIVNLMYQSVQLKSHCFTCQYDTKSYAWLILTNALGILFTLGLFIPWAYVRSAHYKANKVMFIAGEDINTFTAEESQKVSALAEGLADSHDVFEINVGI